MEIEVVELTEDFIYVKATTFKMFKMKCDSTTWHLKAKVTTKDIAGIRCPQIASPEDFHKGFRGHLNIHYVGGFQSSINHFLRFKYGEIIS